MNARKSRKAHPWIWLKWYGNAGTPPRRGDPRADKFRIASREIGVRRRAFRADHTAEAGFFRVDVVCCRSLQFFSKVFVTQTPPPKVTRGYLLDSTKFTCRLWT
ncbi:unnamed protein product, partial [Ascophyllum nodosum]